MSVPQSKMDSFRETFQQYDRDKDNFISMRELSQVMKTFHLNNDFTAEQTEEIMNLLDKRMKGSRLDIELFLNIVAEKYIDFANNSSSEDVINAFRTFDKDGNGTIPADELRNVMTSIGDVLSEEEVEEMIREADINGDGVIYYEDFVMTMASK